MFKILKFEDEHGHIMIEDDYITLYKDDNPQASRKYPMYKDLSQNRKTLGEILKMANLSGYFLTEEALQKYDTIMNEWDSDNE